MKPRAPDWAARSPRAVLARTVACCGLLPAVLAVLLVWPAWAQTAEPAADNLLQKQLAAGEFAPALELARNTGEGAARDGRLQAVALAQAEAGARAASFSTLGEIQDDRVRNGALERLGNESSSGGRGGAAAADFESLIELITSTIEPDSWEEVGGPGAIQEFEGGVHVDALGVMRPIVRETGARWLAEVRQTARRAGPAAEARRPSPLRKVSLPRLEREIQLRLAAGRPLDEEMLVLAGLERVEYVLVYPETHDLVLAGPAGDWTLDAEERLVRTEGGRPVLRLDDLVLLLRHFATSPDGKFGCSITPTEEGLAKAQAFLKQSSGKPLKPGQRGKWLEQLRCALGAQTIEVFGIDPCSRTAHVMVEADYRMKLVGIGLEDGTIDVPSYLEMVQVPAGQAPPPMDVLRWWFTLNYDDVLTSPNRDVFRLQGQGVQVLSENELLTATGQRVHTGKSDQLNQEFAHRFTEHFSDLAAKYPVYAELQNIFDVALVAALVKSEGLADRIEWHMLTFGDPDAFVLATGPMPKAVESVMNHRVVNKKHILAAVSGGVRVDPRKYVAAEAFQVDRKGSLGSEHSRSAPEAVARTAWWWD